MLEVLDLSTGDKRIYSSITPTEAVIAAHAQSLGDYNTWTYKNKYGALVREGKYSVGCENQAVLKEVQ
jgi:hypothetical protein